MNGPEGSPVKLRQIIIDEDETSTTSDSPIKYGPHLDHDYGSASGGRYNSALEFYGDGKNNESFPPIEILASGDEDQGLSPVKGEVRPQLSQQYHRSSEHHSAAPKTFGYGAVNRLAGRTQVFLQNRPRTAYTIPQSFRIRPEQTTPVLSYANSASRIVRPHLTPSETSVQRSTPNVLRQSTVRPRGSTVVRPPRPPKPVVQAPVSPESGLMNVLDEEEAQNQKFFMQQSKMGTNLAQMKPIVSSVYNNPHVPTSMSISPQKSVDGEGIHKPRGRGRPSNAEKAFLLQQQQQHNKTAGPDKNNLQTLAEMALVSPSKPQAPRSPVKPAIQTPVQETKPLEPLASENQAQRLSKKLIVTPKKDEPVKSCESDRDEGEEVEGVDYITRCICELKHNDDYMVQCDQCKAWVHIDCFGGEKAVDVDNKFYCHKCDTKRVNPLSSEEAKRLQQHKIAKAEKNRKKAKQNSVTLSAPERKPHKLLKKTLAKEKENTYSRSVKSDISEGRISEGDIGTYVQLKSIADRRCRNTIVSKGITGLMSIENVRKGDPLIEFKGNFFFVDEEKVVERLNDPITFYRSVVYTGLGPNSKPLFVDSTKSGTAASVARRSCRANAKLSHCVIEGRLVLFLVAAEDIDETSEITLPFDHEERGSPPIHLDCACLTDLAYSAGGSKCLLQDYNDKVANGELVKPTKTSPARKRTVSPEKPSSPKNVRRSPVKSQPKSPRQAPKEITSERRKSEIEKSEASTSKEKVDIKDDSDKESTPRRSSRKRISTNERLSPKLDSASEKPKKRGDTIFDEGEIITGLSRREQQKIQRLEQMDHQNGRRKRSLEQEPKSAKVARRSLPAKEEVPVKKPKAESPEEVAANLLLGLAGTAAKSETSFSAKRQEALVKYWNRCRSQLDSLGPFSNINFSEIQKVAASKKSSTCLTNSESSKLLKTGLQKLKMNSFERSSQSPSTPKARPPLDKSIESHQGSFGQGSVKPWHIKPTTLALSERSEDMAGVYPGDGAGGIKSEDVSKGKEEPSFKGVEETPQSDVSTKKPLSQVAQQRVISFSEAFKTVNAPVNTPSASMIGRNVGNRSFGQPTNLTLDVLMTPQNMQEPPQSAPPAFTPTAISKMKLNSLKERVFGELEKKQTQSLTSTPSLKPPIKLEIHKPLGISKAGSPLAVNPRVLKWDDSPKTEISKIAPLPAILPPLKRLTDLEISESLNRLRSLPVFERIGVQFFKKIAEGKASYKEGDAEGKTSSFTGPSHLCK
ncbi:unnamed protein product [Bursaphelenchus xylophilus]|uniref:(pine wood nematode) hypothetical protein n=1 Tax=Bursaphelenchus xylophilus TaxID=6326 RepID=A0A811LGV9_BURXY|nr:unnamed protein product [Bursaphelenchus xylophilus]CAG9115854.1 unnamed protein product [Bursaphelenchus xylophilus]